MKKNNSLNVVRMENNKQRMYASILYRVFDMESLEGFGLLNQNQEMNDQIHGVVLAKNK